MLATLFSVVAPIVLRGQICPLPKMASFTMKWPIACSLFVLNIVVLNNVILSAPFMEIKILNSH